MFFAGLLAFVVGSAVMLFLSVVILFGIVGSMTSSEPVTVGEHAILKLDFSEDLIESPSSDPFAGIDFATMTARHQVTLYNALRAIETAKNDPRIQGIYLRPNGGGVATYAILEELREALQDFRQGGKFIIAYNETYGQGGYYLASVADKIYLEPHGGMQWTGVSSTLMFYKGLFDKLDIQAEIFRPTACRYKSAVEPYFLSKMSNANREQMQLLVDSYWNVMAEAVAESRGIELSTLNRLADGLEVSLAQEALDHGMVDGLLFEDQMDDVFREYGAVAKNDGQFEFVTLGQYVSQLNADLKNISSSQIAIVYADGAIVDGEGYGADIYGNTLAATLAGIMKERTGAKVRGIELSLLQRCAAHCASGTDIEEAFMSGKTAVEQMVAGQTDKMVGFECDRTNGYTCKAKLFDLSDVANFEKKFPAEWITPEGNNVTEDFIKYAMPLIQGETKLEKENALPRFARLKKVFAK